MLKDEKQQMAEATTGTDIDHLESLGFSNTENGNAVSENHSVPLIRVALIGGNEQYYRTVLTQLQQQYPDVEFVKFISAGGHNAFFVIDTLNPDILLVAHDAPIQNAVQFYEAIKTHKDGDGVPYAEKYKDKRMVVMAPNDMEYAMSLRKQGIKYMLPMINPRFHQVDVELLMRVIHEAYEDIQRNKELREIQASIPATMETPVAQPQMTTPAMAAPAATGMDAFQRRDFAMGGNRRPQYGNYGGYMDMIDDQQPIIPHKVIGIYSGTGGAGSTTFASNLGAILSKYTKDGGVDYRVCVVEYNLVCQNLHLFFGLKFPKQSKKSVTTIAREAYNMFYDTKDNRIKADPRDMAPIIKRYTEHIPDIGLDVIPGISIPMEIDNINSGFARAFFSTLREMYDVVIVDLSSDMAKVPMLEAMAEIDEFYYIMPTSVPGIHNARKLISFLSSMFSKTPEEIKVIINKVDLDNELYGIKQVQDSLLPDNNERNCTPEGTIPYAEKDICTSIDRGIPISVSNPEHPVSQAIFSIALGINPMLSTTMLEQEQEESEKEEKKGGLLGKLFNGGSTKKKEKKAGSKKAVFNKKSSIKQLAAAPAKAAQPAKAAAPVEDEDAIDKELEEDFVEEIEEEKVGFWARLFGKGNKKPKKKKKLTKKN